MYYDKKGNLIDMHEWIAEMEDRILAQDLVGGVLISTVYLGMDHGFDRDRPLIFETMSFPDHTKKTYWMDKFIDEKCERYSSIEEALKGHDEMCKLYEVKLGVTRKLYEWTS